MFWIDDIKYIKEKAPRKRGFKNNRMYLASSHFIPKNSIN